MDLGKLFSIIITSIFIQNYVFGRVLGICPYMGVSKKVESSIGMGMAIIFVISVASTITWLIYQFMLVPFHLEYLQTIMFILIIASLVQFVEMAIQKLSPNLYNALGVYLPLITTNCVDLCGGALCGGGSCGDYQAGWYVGGNDEDRKSVV